MDIQLTHHTRSGGCAAKIGPGDLSSVLCGIDVPEDANVIAGLNGFEDAGVYRLSDDLVIVQTVDFFTPVVNDPYWFGRIAAANALSDIYAMGARPVTALNIVCFSPKRFGASVLRDILRGGIDTIKESCTSLLGGHSVEDEEIKYGLSVTGIVRPDRIVRNEGAQPGDLLVLTKPLGTGILITALKGNLVSKETEELLIGVMSTLNRRASEVMLSSGAHAATDVTGFGLAGHLKEMIKDNLGAEVYVAKLPCLPEAEMLAKSGFLPKGFYSNRDFYTPYVEAETGVFLLDLIFDPQSSGGLLIAMSEADIGHFREEASKASLDFWIIGRFIEEPKGTIRIK
ncbi:MAG TPA: selenide, water dikinase SelD [Syntrophorhabdaceae bacterium]|nr:selenide, water dikinase SelD [Syntrophorhabdaceae bacterium]HQM82961.1 selenide, water dikinase SelD [Syntrophorhabdaceae bacterium]